MANYGKYLSIALVALAFAACANVMDPMLDSQEADGRWSYAPTRDKPPTTIFKPGLINPGGPPSPPQTIVIPTVPGLSTYKLKNIDTTVVINGVSKTVRKAKEAGCITLFMSGTGGKVSFKASDRSFQRPSVFLSNESLQYNATARPNSGEAPYTFDDVVRAEVENAPNCDHILIAHSHGGLRALAYANILSQLGVGDRIKAIIFVASPVRGHPALVDTVDSSGRIVEKGEVTFQKKLNDLKYMFAGKPELKGAGGGIEAFQYAYEYREKAPLIEHFNLVDGLNSFMPTVTEYPTLLNATYSDSALNAMKPNSDWARTYLGVRFNAVSFNSANESTKIPCQVVLPTRIKIGFIVGANNDPVDFIDDSESFNVGSFRIGYKTIARYLLDTQGSYFLRGYPNVFYTSLTHYEPNTGYRASIWQALATENLQLQEQEKYAKTNSEKTSIFIKYILNEGRRNALVKMSQWLSNYKANYGAILGSVNNDGIIPEYVQSRPIYEIGGSPIATEYIKRIPSATHFRNKSAAENEGNPDIWGAGGSWNAPIGNSGAIAQWYNANANDTNLTAAERQNWLQAKKDIVVNF